MINLERYKIDGRATRINDTDFSSWWLLQQHFAYPPFNEFFDTDKLIEYYEEFKNGGIHQLEINVRDDIWLPVALLSWHPMEKGAHPVSFAEEKVAYISDSITCRAYQEKGIQTKLFEYTFEEMKRQGYEAVYLRTSPYSHMCKLALKMGFLQVENAFQEVSSMRVGGIVERDIRIFFYKKF